MSHHNLTDAEFQHRVEELRKKQFQHIEEYGFTVMNIFGTQEGEKGHPAPAFSYTTGNFLKLWPEIILIGDLGQRAPMAMLHEVIDAWKAHGSPIYGDVRTENLSIHHVRISAPLAQSVKEEYTKQVKHFKGDEEYQVVQLLWPDEKGLFPDEPGYNPEMAQPILPLA